MKPHWSWRVWNGKTIAGLRGAVVGRKKAAEMIACLNALLTWKVRTGDKDVGEVLISDTDATLVLPKGGGSDTSTQSGGGATRYRVKSVEDDYTTCRTWDGSTEGASDVLIAKPPELRHSLTSQTIKNDLGNNQSVTYSGFGIVGGKCTRTAAASGYANQGEIVLPQYILAGTTADAEIWADEPVGGTGVTVSGNELTWMDTNRAGRKWCQVS